MKKLFLFLMILLTVQVFGQNINKPTFDEDEKKIANEVFDYKIDANRVLLSPVRFMYGFYDTAGATADTLSRRIFQGETVKTWNHLGHVFLSWYQFSFMVDDTIQISSTTDFTAGTTLIIMPDIPYVSSKIALGYISNIYYKRYGTAGTPNVYVIVEGN